MGLPRMEQASAFLSSLESTMKMQPHHAFAFVFLCVGMWVLAIALLAIKNGFYRTAFASPSCPSLLPFFFPKSGRLVTYKRNPKKFILEVGAYLLLTLLVFWFAFTIYTSYDCPQNTFAEAHEGTVFPCSVYKN